MGAGGNDRGTSLFPPPASQHLMGTGGEGDFKHHSLRVSYSYPSQHQQMDHTHSSTIRRHSDEISNSSRAWTNYSSQSSRYSYSGSELSDEVLEGLPSDLRRRNSFSKNSPLPLPESMQPQPQHGMGMGGMEFGSGDGGMGFSQSHSQQNGFLDHTCSTMPLRHYGNGRGGGSAFSSQSSHGDAGGGGVFSSQDSSHLSGDGYEAYISRMHYMSPGSSIVSPSNNMVVGNMETFTQTLSEETQYYETVYQPGQLSNAQVK